MPGAMRAAHRSGPGVPCSRWPASCAKRGALVAVLSNNGTLMAERWPAIKPAWIRRSKPGSSARPATASETLASSLSALPRRTETCRPRATFFCDDSATNMADAREAGLTGDRSVDLPTLSQMLATRGVA